MTLEMLLSGNGRETVSKKKDGRVFPVGVGSTHHIGERESQQDSFAISDISNDALFASKGVFGAVADGMGGMADGAILSSIVTKTMLQYFSETDSSGNPEFDLLSMLFAADGNVNRYLSEHGSGRGGSTAVAAIIKDARLYWISVGDSRIYLNRGDAVLQLNRPHTYGIELDEKAARGELSWRDAASDLERESLTSYLGNRRLEKIDRCASPVILAKNDSVLLLTDGVFSVLSDEEISGAMSGEPHRYAENIERLLLERHHPNQDNFTAVVFEYKGV
jgi:protein phosphatase